MTPLLRAEKLRVAYRIRVSGRGVARFREVEVLRGVSLFLNAGEVVGVVGESGCGKSTLARALVRIVPIKGGRIFFQDRDVTEIPERRLRPHRRLVQMIFQDPFASLNPRLTVYETLAEPLLVHRVLDTSSVPKRVQILMDRVGLAARWMHRYPHEFSGGQRQRIAIARALALQPKVLIADEPVSALDVSIQAQILNLLQDLVAEEGLGLLFISHDLAVIRHIAHRVCVMYLGEIVETAPAATLFTHPRHPYTRMLLSAMPRLEPATVQPLSTVTGEPPSFLESIPGCPFHPRCPYAMPVCREQIPNLESVGSNHEVRCLRTADF